MNIPAYLKQARYRQELDGRRKKSVGTIIFRVGDTMSIDNIMSLTKFKDVDRRLLFLWSRRHELRPMIEAANPALERTLEAAPEEILKAATLEAIQAQLGEKAK